jgi:hypothetical protein
MIKTLLSRGFARRQDDNGKVMVLPLSGHNIFLDLIHHGSKLREFFW